MKVILLNAKTTEIEEIEYQKVNDIEVDFKRIRKIVADGGNVEVVKHQNLDDMKLDYRYLPIMLVDEEGKLKKGIPENEIASEIYGTHEHGEKIVGNAIVCLLDLKDEDGRFVGFRDEEATEYINKLNVFKENSQKRKKRIDTLLLENKNIIEKALKENNNLCFNLLTEECSELIQAIKKIKRLGEATQNFMEKILLAETDDEHDKYEKLFYRVINETDKRNDNLNEEIADVYISLDLFIKAAGINENKVKDKVVEKLERMNNRIDEGEFY